MTTGDAPRTRRDRSAATIAHPGWKFALGLFACNAIIFGACTAVGADHGTLMARKAIVANVVTPLARGALLIVVAPSMARCGRPVLVETRPAQPRWTIWPVLLAMPAPIATPLAGVDWRSNPPEHLLLVALAALLVGLNEEAPARVAPVAGFRGAGSSETRVWLLSRARLGGVIGLSERSGSFDVRRRGPEGGEPVQVTRHETWPLRFLCAAGGGALAYAWNGAVQRLPPGENLRACRSASARPAWWAASP